MSDKACKQKHFYHYLIIAFHEFTAELYDQHLRNMIIEFYRPPIFLIGQFAFHSYLE